MGLELLGAGAAALFEGITASGFAAGATAVGSAAAVAGAGASIYGNIRSAEASKRAENLRQKQMELQHMREIRQIFRQSQNARAVALSNAVGSGAKESSALPGGYGQIAGAAGAMTTAANENLDIGRGLFSANRDTATGKEIAGVGGGLYQLGKDVIGSSEAIGRIGSTYFNGKKRNITTEYDVSQDTPYTSETGYM